MRSKTGHAQQCSRERHSNAGLTVASIVGQKELLGLVETALPVANHGQAILGTFGVADDKEPFRLIAACVARERLDSSDNILPCIPNRNARVEKRMAAALDIAFGSKRREKGEASRIEFPPLER